MSAAEVYKKTRKVPDLFWNAYVCRPVAAVLVDAVKGVKRLDRRACRQEVEQRFNASRMATDYETVYRRLLDTSHSAP